MSTKTDYSHYDALLSRLSNERDRLTRAKTNGEKELRTVWVSQLEREVADERTFLGISEIDDLSADELLEKLGL